MQVKLGNVVYAKVTFDELHIDEEAPFRKLIEQYPSADVIILSSYEGDVIIKNTFK